MTPGTPPFRTPRDPEQAHEPLLRHFRYAHLADERLRSFSQRYAALAEHVCASMAPSAERTLALRDLVRAKDQGVRALLDELYPATDPPPNERFRYAGGVQSPIDLEREHAPAAPPEFTYIGPKVNILELLIRLGWFATKEFALAAIRNEVILVDGRPVTWGAYVDDGLIVGRVIELKNHPHSRRTIQRVVEPTQQCAALIDIDTECGRPRNALIHQDRTAKFWHPFLAPSE